MTKLKGLPTSLKQSTLSCLLVIWSSSPTVWLFLSVQVLLVRLMQKILPVCSQLQIYEQLLCSEQRTDRILFYLRIR
eukprot:XP_001707886.1 Hypothetical protein GL50803_35089 [Giardia lamblia ATCC 50803]